MFSNFQELIGSGVAFTALPPGVGPKVAVAGGDVKTVVSGDT